MSGRRTPHALSTSVAAAFVALALILVPAVAAQAYWPGAGTGTASSTTGELLAPTDVTVPATSTGDVSVTWTASAGSPAPTGYHVTRTTGSTTVDACASSAAAPITGTSCTDSAVADGSYVYRVTAVFRSWTAPSTASGTVIVTAPPTRTALDVGDAASFSVLAGSSIVSPGTSAVDGDLGVGVGGAIGGFPPGTLGGVQHVGDDAAGLAKSALVAAYADGTSRAADSTFFGDQNGVTFFAGVHETLAAFELTGTLTLDGEGDANAVFIIHIRAAMNIGEDSIVVLTGEATAANVFWVVEGAANTGARSVLVGTILADGAITLGSATHLTGRALSTADVTLADVVVNAP